MKLINKLTDKEFPYDGVDHIRDISRGIIYNDKNEIAFIHLFGDDIFGHRDYLETPGGGKEENETGEETLIREIKEELGVTIDNIEEIGLVIDNYNLLKRENHNYYYIGHVKEKVSNKQNEFEKMMFKEILWIKVDEALKVFDSYKDTPISRLVKNRELPVIKLAIERIEKINNH